LNYQDQGSGSDILALAIAGLPEEIAHMMLMPVHDELVFEVPIDQVKYVHAQVRLVMMSAADRVLGYAIPIEIESEIGETWAGG